MAERYIRPPLIASEPAPRWLAVWRFRIAVILLTALVVAIGVLAYRHFTHTSSQNPTINAAAAVRAA